MRYLRGAAMDDGYEGESDYAFTLPATRALPDITFETVTVLVGDNGTGKSTLVEALAVAAGFNAEGGSKNLRFSTHSTHSNLARALVLTFDRMPRWGWFFRAETYYGMASYIATDDDPAAGIKGLFPDLHNRSHGESFVTLMESRMMSDGLYFLDEPESALSFVGQLRLLRIMHEAIGQGAQFILATHSPLLMAFPGAAIYELDDTGARRVHYDEVDTVSQWRTFLADPDRYFHHLFSN